MLPPPLANSGAPVYFLRLMLALLLGHALAADPRASLLEAYTEIDQRADHVLLVDQGLEPADLGALPRSLGALARTLPSGDTLTVFGFDAEARELLPRTSLDAEGRDALASTLESLRLAPGASSDLGVALAAARDQLRRPGAAPIQMLLVVSDLCHEPPTGSPYAFAGQSGCGMLRGVGELEAAFTALRGERLLLPVSVTVGTPDKDGRAAIARTLGASRALAFRADEPEGWTQLYAENLAFRKVEALIEREVQRFSFQAELGEVVDGRVPLTLKSGLQRVSVDLDSLNLTTPELVPETRKLTLSPDATIQLEIVPPEPPFSPIPASRRLVFEGQVTATATLEPRAALSRIGVPPGRGLVRAPLRVELTQRYGPPPWAFGLGLAALAAGGLAWVRRRVGAQRGGTGPEST